MFLLTLLSLEFIQPLQVSKLLVSPMAILAGRVDHFHVLQILIAVQYHVIVGFAVLQKLVNAVMVFVSLIVRPAGSHFHLMQHKQR